MTTTAVYKILKKDIERGPRGFPGPGGPAGGTFIHSELNNLDYATAGHTGFATAAQGALADAALPAANYTAADVLAKLLTVDGTGSLLDADKLDGQEGAWYAPIDSPEFTTLVSLTGATNPNYRVTDSTNSVITKLQSLDLQGLVGTESNHDFQIRTNNVIVALFDTDGNVQEPNFTAGFAAAGGTNWQITAAGDASFDDLLVRGSARFRELIIDQLSVIGGSTLQSAARGKIASINVGDSTVTLEDPYDNGVCAFESDDFFWSKNVDIDNSTAVTDCQGQITNVTGLVLTLDFGVADANGAIGDLSVGDILVQRGNEDDSSGAEDRQNLIYTTVSDADAPFRRVLSGIDSLAAFTDLDNVVLQDGNLENLAGHDIVPVNPGYGLYSSNVYLSGEMRLPDAGLSSVVTGGDDVRIWAGDTYANRAIADFNVTESGALTATGVAEFGTAAINLGDGAMNVAIQGSDIWENALNGFSYLKINRIGYDGGATQFRGLVIYDGKAHKAITYDPTADPSFIIGNSGDPLDVNTKIYGTLTLEDALTVKGATEFDSTVQMDGAVTINEDALCNKDLRISAPGYLRVSSYTTVQRNALSSVPNGTIIYDSTTDQFSGMCGGTWYYFTMY